LETKLKMIVDFEAENEQAMSDMNMEYCQKQQEQL
jgi:hypothetical protein